MALLQGRDRSGTSFDFYGAGELVRRLRWPSRSRHPRRSSARARLRDNELDDSEAARRIGT